MSVSTFPLRKRVVLLGATGSVGQNALRVIAAKEGMITLGGDALARAARGVTTLEEALRVTPEKQRA